MVEPQPHRTETAIRRRIHDYIESRSDLAPADFEALSWPMLCVWRVVEATYDLEGVGPSGPRGFTLEDFYVNLEDHYPEVAAEFGADFARTLVEQYVSMIADLPGGRSESAAVAQRLDHAVDDLIRSDLPSVKLH